MACQEMELYYAYLDAVEEAKRKAQPWQCEVTLMPENGEAPKFAAEAVETPVKAAKPAKTVKPAGKPGFVCDDPE
jgi:hypothetical protein